MSGLCLPIQFLCSRDEPHTSGTRAPALRGKTGVSLLPNEFLLRQFFSRIENPHSSWNETNPICSWYGVSCDWDGEVTRIGWSRRGFKGSLVWGSAPRTIKTIEITQNVFIGGTLDFQQLPLGILTVIVRRNRHLGILPLDELPSSICEIDVYGNYLEGHLSLVSLPEVLRRLTLTANKFNGTPDFNFLPSGILHLSLARNRCTGHVLITSLPVSPNLFLEARENHFWGLLQVLCPVPSGYTLSFEENHFDPTETKITGVYQDKQTLLMKCTICHEVSSF